MGSAFHQLCPRYSGTLTPTAPTAIRLWDTFTFYRDTILTSDLLATLTLGLGTKMMCATHLLIMFYLSVKFYQIFFSSLQATQF